MDTGIQTGLVTGRIVDPRMPGRTGRPVDGLKVTLTPQMQAAVAAGATPPVIVLPAPVHCKTNPDGLLVTADWREGQSTGVEVAATDADGVVPPAWTWLVVVHSPDTAVQRWSIQVPAGQTTDLATALHVPSDVGEAILEWQQVRAVAVQAAEDAQQSAVDAEEAAAAAEAVAQVTFSAALGGPPGTVMLTFPALAAGPYPDTVRVPIGN